MRKVSIADTLTARLAATVAESLRAPTQDSVLVSTRYNEPSTPGVSMPAPRVPVVKEEVVGSHFKLIFVSVLLLTVGTLIGDIILVWMLEEPTAAQQNLISGLESVWKGGVGAILGLLGGRVT